jgi:phasin family protein
MAVKFDDFSTYTDFAKRAMAPATRLNETVAGHVERLARFQYEVAGDWLQFAIEQMQATAKAKDFGALMTRQSEIASRFVDKATQRQQALAKLTTETQASLARWADEATAVGRTVA